jgi:hypothetical protein
VSGVALPQPTVRVLEAPGTPSIESWKSITIGGPASFPGRPGREVRVDTRIALVDCAGGTLAPTARRAERDAATAGSSMSHHHAVRSPPSLRAISGSSRELKYAGSATPPRPRRLGPSLQRSNTAYTLFAILPRASRTRPRTQPTRTTIAWFGKHGSRPPAEFVGVGAPSRQRPAGCRYHGRRSRQRQRHLLSVGARQHERHLRIPTQAPDYEPRYAPWTDDVDAFELDEPTRLDKGR